MIKQNNAPGRERMVKNRWKVALFCIAIALAPIVGFLTVGISADTQSMGIQYVETREDGKMVFRLYLEGSGVAFSMVTQSMEGDVLVIKPRVSLVSVFHKKGQADVITKLPIDEIGEIQLQGENQQDRELVWNNKDGK